MNEVSYHKLYYEKNKIKLRQYQREYYHKNKNKDKKKKEPKQICMTRLFGNFVLYWD